MNDDLEQDEYEVGYKKPPKSGQFRKGMSGNPSGRPKKTLDFESQLLRELNSQLTITENGKQRRLRKSEVMFKQLVNKASSTAHTPTARLLFPYYVQALEKVAEREQHAQKMAKRTVQEMSDEELWAILGADPKASHLVDKFLKDYMVLCSSTEADTDASVAVTCSSIQP